MLLNSASFEVAVEECLKFALSGSILFSRLMQVQWMGEYATLAGWRRFFYPLFMVSLPFCAFKLLIDPSFHIINHEYFRVTNVETAMREQQELQHDLFRDVDDIKYHYQYHTARQYYATRFKFHEGQQMVMKGLAREYYQHQYGLKTDPFEEWAVQREQQRKQNKHTGHEDF